MYFSTSSNCFEDAESSSINFIDSTPFKNHNISTGKTLNDLAKCPQNWDLRGRRANAPIILVKYQQHKNYNIKMYNSSENRKFDTIIEEDNMHSEYSVNHPPNIILNSSRNSDLNASVTNLSCTALNYRDHDETATNAKIDHVSNHRLVNHIEYKETDTQQIIFSSNLNNGSKDNKVSCARALDTVYEDKPIIAERYEGDTDMIKSQKKKLSWNSPSFTSIRTQETCKWKGFGFSVSNNSQKKKNIYSCKTNCIDFNNCSINIKKKYLESPKVNNSGISAYLNQPIHDLVYDFISSVRNEPTINIRNPCSPRDVDMLDSALLKTKI